MLESHVSASNYKMLQTGDDGRNSYCLALDISTLVEEHLRDGWVLYGPPVMNKGAIFQAVIKIDVPK